MTLVTPRVLDVTSFFILKKSTSNYPHNFLFINFRKVICLIYMILRKLLTKTNGSDYDDNLLHSNTNCEQINISLQQLPKMEIYLGIGVDTYCPIPRDCKLLSLAGMQQNTKHCLLTALELESHAQIRL